MFGFGARAGTFIIAAALLFAAMKIHKSAGKHQKITKPIGIVVAFLAGLVFLITFVGDWMGNLAGVGGAVGVAGLIVCSVIIIIDWLDGRPDKGAFWAALFLAMFIVFGVSQIPRATGDVGKGADRVGTQMSRVGK